MAEINEKVYIGDGVFIHYDGFHVVLQTSDGYSFTNEIALDPEVMKAVVNFIQKLKGE